MPLDELGQPALEDIDPDVDWPALRHNLTLTPAQRLDQHQQMLAFVLSIRAEGEKLYGPAHPEPTVHRQAE